MILKDAAKKLVEEKEIIICKIDDYFFITYEDNKFNMSQYKNKSFSSREKFINKVFVDGLEANDGGVFEGENNLETAEAAIIDFLNVYAPFEIETAHILV